MSDDRDAARRAAEAIGVNVRAYKLLAFVLGAALAGVFLFAGTNKGSPFDASDIVDVAASQIAVGVFRFIEFG